MGRQHRGVVKPAPVPLPPEFRLAVDPRVTVADGGRLLLGGSPMRMLRLSAEGATVFRALRRGQPVREAGRGAGRLARRLLDAAFATPLPPDGVGPAEVTVAVPVRDRAALLTGLLASCRDEGCAAILVCDDGSRDASAAVAREAGARVLTSTTSAGPATARNRLLAAATTRFVAFLDSDCLPPRGWLRPLLPHFADPAVAAVAPRVAVDPGSARLLDRYETVRSPLDLGSRAAAVRPGSPVSYLPAAALVVRRDAARAVGGFEPRLRHGEDVDLVWRLRAAGWTVRFEPASTVFHPARSGLVELARQRFGYGTSAAALARRHPGTLRPLAGAHWVLASWLATRGPRWLAPALAAGSTARLARRLDRWPHRWAAATRLTAQQHRRVALEAAESLTRVWWPVTLLVGVRRPALRRALLAAVLASSSHEWWRRRPRVPLPAYLALRLVDDLAYGSGVWWGCVRHRSLAPLLPGRPVGVNRHR